LHPETQNAKFKTDKLIAEHLLSNRNFSVLGILDLDIIWDLAFEIWDFKLVSRETNYFYLSQL
jgi:hypothetical protein